MSRPRPLLPALLAAVTLLAGCTVAAPQKTREPAPEPEPSSSTAAAEGSDPAVAVPAELGDFYTQDVDWGECGTDLECAVVEVPLDYAAPDGETIEVAVARVMTAGAGAPMLFLNPGGPGSSGTAMMEWITYSLSDTLMGEYNLVGFDPRGVNLSTAVECISDAELDAWRADDVDTATLEGLEAISAEAREFGEECADNTGELLGRIDTESAARDLDILRAVVGEAETLDYLGYSYATFLGAVYADLFPERVGHFTLDGAVDPTLSLSELASGQTAGFERALRAYMTECLTSAECPFTGSVDDGLATLRQFLDVVRATPLPTGDPARPLTYPLAFSGILLPMYTNALWPQLTAALDAAIFDDDGSQLLYWADWGAGRLEDGSYEDNSNEAFMAINCLDYPVEGTLEDWRADAEVLRATYPIVQDDLAFSEITCDAWPHASQRVREPIAASGSAPILVVGTTGDPATPYEWAVSLADQLEAGHLLTYDGNGHTAYGRSNQCVTDAVDAFMTAGTLPGDGATC